MNADQNDPLQWNPLQNKSARKGKGRKKINIEKIENENNLHVTFSKRRVGLFKKASELAILIGAQLLLIFFSPSGKPYLFAHPDIETITNKYRGRNQNHVSTETDLHLLNQMTQLNEELVQMETQLQLEKNKAKEVDRDIVETRSQGHWCCPDIHDLGEKEVPDLEEKSRNFNVVMDDLLENHHLSMVNPNTNTYPIPNIYQNTYAPDPTNIAASTGIDEINFPRPNQAGTNLMDHTVDPMWEQFSTFTITPTSGGNSSNITIPVNPIIGNAASDVLQPGNYMVPPVQDNLENMFSGMFTYNYSGYGNYVALNQGNVQNMFQSTLPNQGNDQNMFHGLNSNNNDSGNSTAPGQNNDL